MILISSLSDFEAGFDPSRVCLPGTRIKHIVDIVDWVWVSTGPDLPCGILTVMALAGMGKTTLVARFAQAAAPQFERVFWRSLGNAPPIEELLADWEANLDRVIAGDTFIILMDGKPTHYLMNMF